MCLQSICAFTYVYTAAVKALQHPLSDSLTFDETFPALVTLDTKYAFPPSASGGVCFCVTGGELIEEGCDMH